MASDVPTRAGRAFGRGLAGGRRDAGPALRVDRRRSANAGIIRRMSWPMLQAETVFRLLCGIDRPDAWHTEPESRRHLLGVDSRPYEGLRFDKTRSPAGVQPRNERPRQIEGKPMGYDGHRARAQPAGAARPPGRQPRYPLDDPHLALDGGDDRRSSRRSPAPGASSGSGTTSSKLTLLAKLPSKAIAAGRSG